MFGFLKDKLKKAIAKFSGDIEQESEDASKAPEEKPVLKKQPKAAVSRPAKKDKKKEQKKAAPEKETKRETKKEELAREKKEGQEKEPAQAREKKEEQEATAEKESSIGEEELTREEKLENETEKKSEAPQESAGFFSKIKSVFQKKERPLQERPAPAKKEVQEAIVKKEGEKEDKEGTEEHKKQVEEQKQEHKKLEKPEESRGFFSKLTDVVTKTTISEAKFDELFWELEIAMLESNVASEVVDKIKGDLKQDLVDKKLPRGGVEEAIVASLRKSVQDAITVPGIDLLNEVKKKKPYIIVLVGVNGSGKTTTIAKLCKYFENNKLSCVIAAADTFRAAAIQQLEEHADKLQVKLIKHDYGADPAAVAFDAVKYAQSKHVDVVLVDTAGRLHSNTNLMDEMKKIVRVAKPDLKLFIGESITGNDCVEQARQFHDAVGVDGIILAKADVDEKGGAAVSVSYVTGKPILFLGTGQKYEDLMPFDAEVVLENVGLGAHS